MNANELINYIENDFLNEKFEKLYYKKENAKKRYINCIKDFEKEYDQSKNLSIFSSPGRTEIGGNHTDHQHGRVLAGAINLDTIAVVSPNNEETIKICSKEYGMNKVDINNLNVILKEKNTSQAIIRGIVSKFTDLGYKISGFNAYTTSDVLCGSGLSSSACFELLICTIINHLFCNNSLSAITLAQISQYAENVFFGKPCGLMDQTACAVGGIVLIDFKNLNKPFVENIPFKLQDHGYSLVITNTKDNHADLTDDYSSIPLEMKSIANYFNKDFLRDVNEKDFLKEISNLRKLKNDRAILRAIHFFNDNNRVLSQVEVLKKNDFKSFLKLVNESSNSSSNYLQNIYSCNNFKGQGISLALCLSKQFFKENGACRVHGGGFAGTIQAYIPNKILNEYVKMIENVFGEKSCYILNIRNYGAIKVI